MAESYTVEAVLTAVDKSMGSTLSGLQKAISGLEKTSSAFDTIADKSSSMFKSMLGANLASSFITNMVGTVKTGFGEMIGELNSSKKAWDTFDGNLSKLGWGKDQINQAKEAMQDYATKTIYSASDMASTFSQMAAIGREDSGQLVEAMGGLAASAENPKQAMTSLSQQMVQALAKPKITWQDFRIMMEQAPAGMSAVAKEMGMSLNDLIIKIQAGQVKTNDFAEAFKRAGLSMQDMATSYKTIDQAMDGLKETLANKLKPAFDTLSKAGIRALEAIMNQLDKVDFNKFASMLEGFLSNVNFDEIANKISNFVSTSVAKIKEFWKSFTDTGALSSFKQALDELWVAFKHVVSSLAGGDVASAGETIGKAMNIASQAIQSFAKIVQSLSPEQIQKIVASFLVFRTARNSVGLATTALQGLSGAVSITKGAVGGLKSFSQVSSALIGIARGSQAASSALVFMAEGSTLAKIALGGLNIISKIGGWIMPAISAIGTFISGIMEGSAIAGAFSSAWGAIVAVITGPVGWIIGIVVAIVAAFVLLWNKCEGFRNFFINMWNGIVASASSAWEGIKSTFGVLVEWFGTLWNSIKESASSAWNGFVENTRPIVEALKNVWNSLVEFFTVLKGKLEEFATNVWNKFLEGAQPIVEGIINVWNALKEFFTTLGTIIIEKVGAVWNDILTQAQPVVANIQSFFSPLVDFFSQLWSTIQSQSTTLWNGFTETLAPVIDSIKTIWNALIEFLSLAWNRIVENATIIWGFLQPMIETTWNNITQAISTAINFILPLIQNGLAAIQVVWQAVWSVLGIIVSTAWNLISTIISTVLNVIAGLINAATAAIQGDWSGAWNAILGVLQTVWNGIQSVVSTVINAVLGIITAILTAILNIFTMIWDNIKSFVSGAIEAIKNTVISAGNALKDGFLSAMDSLSSGVSGVIDTVTGFFNQLWNIDLSAAGQAIMDGFLGGLKSAWGAVQDFVGGIASWIAAHKGPISYDRKLLIPAGQAIMDGFNTALMGGFATVQGNVSGMADGIASMFDNAGSRVSAMSNALQGDFSNNVSGTLSATYEVNQTKEPAVINLSLGSNDFKAFVSDISNVQSKEERIRLKASSL